MKLTGLTEVDDKLLGVIEYRLLIMGTVQDGGCEVVETQER